MRLNGEAFVIQNIYDIHLLQYCVEYFWSARSLDFMTSVDAEEITCSQKFWMKGANGVFNL